MNNQTLKNSASAYPTYSSPNYNNLSNTMLPLNKSPSSINQKSKSPIINNNINSTNSNNSNNNKINFIYGPE